MTEPKIESKGSIGIYAKTKQEQKSLMADHDERLQTALIDACEDSTLPDGVRDEIIQQGMARFVIDKDNNLRPLSVYKTVRELIDKCKKDNDSIMDEVRNFADERAVKKQKLKELMVHYANEGDSKSYRNIRREYAMI